MEKQLPYEPEASKRSHFILHPVDPIGLPIPPRLTSFVGRAQEIRELTALLKEPETRLVTITGPGGVGKTRLAFEVATRISEEFLDGITLIDMSAVTTPSLVAPVFAQALGMRQSGNRPLAERLVEALRDRQVLMVIDGFDYVVTAAPLVLEVVAGCSGVTGLVTSREALNVSGEWNVPISPLGLPEIDQSPNGAIECDAVRLFADRAQAAKSDFRLSDENFATVGQIVGRVDGLPLAIELAAARLAHLPPATLLERLESRLPFLTGGARDLPERQRTLRSTIAWSYDLLSPAEQSLFRQLSVFVGGCSLKAAESIPQKSQFFVYQILDEVSSLVAKSLLKQEADHTGAPRYTMLETVREFGLERLAERGEEPSARDVHADYFLELAERADPAIWGGSDHAQWLDILEADLDNFRSALAWLEQKEDASCFVRMAAALGGLWHYRSHRIEGQAWLSKALAAGEISAPLARAMAFVKLSMLERVLGGKDSADLARQGLQIRVREGDRRGAARAMVNLSKALQTEGKLDQAEILLKEAALLFDEVGDISGLANTRMFLASMRLAEGDVTRAYSMFHEALGLFRQIGFIYGVASVLIPISELESRRGELALAADHLTESLHHLKKVKSQEGLADCLSAIASFVSANDHPTEAVRLVGSAMAASDALGYVGSALQQKRNADTLAVAKKAIGEPQFDRALQNGRLSSLAVGSVEAAQVLSHIAKPSSLKSAEIEILTAREMDVLRLLVQGHTDQEIAYILGLKYRTVTSYVSNILDKFGAPSRTAVAAQAVRMGIV